MRTITLLDTAVASTNLGDQIIMGAAEKQVRSIIKDAFIYSIPTHEIIFRRSYKLLRKSEYAFVGGSNLLNSRMWFYRLWKVSIIDALFIKNLILFGCGWYQYQKNTDLYTKLLLRTILSKEKMHSVRDNYTKEKLADIGIMNTINTGCPTLWELSPEHCSAIPRQKAENVLCTLTIYNRNTSLDTELIRTLKKNYRKIYFWIQTAGDYVYSKGIDPHLEYIEPSLCGLDQLLFSNEDIDYIGTRLHAGIRALQAKRRSIIVEIDNRAREMGKNFNLPTVERDNSEKLNTLIKSDFTTSIDLDHDAINQWKSQFNPPETGGG